MNFCHSGDAVNSSGSLSGIGKRLSGRSRLARAIRSRRGNGGFTFGASPGQSSTSPSTRPGLRYGSPTASLPPHEMPQTNTGSHARSARSACTNSATSSSSRRKLGRRRDGPCSVPTRGGRGRRPRTRSWRTPRTTARTSRRGCGCRAGTRAAPAARPPARSGGSRTSSRPRRRKVASVSQSASPSARSPSPRGPGRS